MKSFRSSSLCLLLPSSFSSGYIHPAPLAVLFPLLLSSYVVPFFFLLFLLLNSTLEAAVITPPPPRTAPNSLTGCLFPPNQLFLIFVLSFLRVSPFSSGKKKSTRKRLSGGEQNVTQKSAPGDRGVKGTLLLLFGAIFRFFIRVFIMLPFYSSSSQRRRRGATGGRRRRDRGVGRRGKV